jgi:hypothetical protein
LDNRFSGLPPDLPYRCAQRIGNAIGVGATFGGPTRQGYIAKKWGWRGFQASIRVPPGHHFLIEGDQ